MTRNAARDVMVIRAPATATAMDQNPTATTSMADIALWYLIINDKKERVGSNFLEPLPPYTFVAQLAKKIKDDNSTKFVSTSIVDLTVWKWTNGLLAKKQKTLDGQLSNFHEQVGVRELESEEVLGDLKWSSDDDLLVVQMPPVPGASTCNSYRRCLTSPPAITRIAGADITVWYLIVNDRKECVGQSFKLSVSSVADVTDLTKMIMETSRLNVGVHLLKMWRCKNRNLGKSTAGALKDHIKDFNFSEKSEDVEFVVPEDMVGELGLDPKEKLLVQVPGMSHSKSFVHAPGSLP